MLKIDEIYHFEKLKIKKPYCKDIQVNHLRQ
jgi:hypothetical protein